MSCIIFNDCLCTCYPFNKVNNHSLNPLSSVIIGFCLVTVLTIFLDLYDFILWWNLAETRHLYVLPAIAIINIEFVCIEHGSIMAISLDTCLIMILS